jgi:hypothetical protein
MLLFSGQDPTKNFSIFEATLKTDVGYIDLNRKPFMSYVSEKDGAKTFRRDKNIII